MLELKEITKSYKIGDIKQQVLKGININFRKSEFASILGASGSGKTTLLNIIGGLDHYDDGDLVIEGVSTKEYIDRDWDSYRNYRVGFIFQNYNLIGHQTILSNVELALTLSGISKKERKKKAIDALTAVGLKDHVNKRPNQLSGGQMQRVAIARALVNDPEIILADEPTGALDSETSVQIMEILKKVSKDKLVIMVTHNPELAKVYSTRIIELKDGLIINDSNSYKNVKELKSTKDIKRTSMSFMTSLGLSFNNLMTKKGRTFLTAFAGSIGIIGIALIMSLSNGVSKYVSNIERNSLSDYPIAIEKQSYDFSKLLDTPESEKVECSGDDLCSSDDISNSADLMKNSLMKKNDLQNVKKYLENNQVIKDNVTEIQYSYDLDLQIYSKNHDNYIRINPNNFNVFSDSVNTEQAGVTVSSNNKPDNLFTEMFENQDVLDSKYEVLKGSFPSDYNEMVLIVGKDNIIPDSVLYSLDIKDRKDLAVLLEKIANKEDTKVESKTYSYDDILGLSYKLVLNTDYYKYENGFYRDYSNDKKYMSKIVNNGLDIKIVGILRAKDDSVKTGVIGYKHSLTEYVIDGISKTSIYKDQTSNKDVNVITNEVFNGIDDTYENNCSLLGIANLDEPSSVSIYPKNFDSKEKILKEIDNYNDEQNASNNTNLVITYTDLIKTMVSGVTSIINIVSYVLMGFVAISLIVSSIMIAIITYISVLERTREIGILRAIGASKKDITRVFRAETVIEGFVAGILGVGITMLLCFQINLIVKLVAKVENIASVPVGGAIFLIVLSTILTVIAGSIPSKMANKKEPVEALRSE